MPLETASYPPDLVTSNPAASDGLNNADDHLRLIKAVVKNSLPNITGPITATQTDINTVAAWATNGASVLAGAGAMFGTNPTDGFKNTLAGDIDVQLQGTIAATFQRTVGVNTLKVFGGITATGEIKGPGITPLGAAVMWFDDVLPTDGLWVWANGQIIANANTVAPTLLARWGSRFGGNGTTTMGVPNMQEVVPVGKSGMGGATAPGLLTSIATGVKDVIAALFGVDTVTLSLAQIPAHTHPNTLSDPGHTHNFRQPDGPTSAFAGGVLAAINSFTYPAGTTSSTTGISISNASQGGGGSHTNLQPSRAVNWIIRIG